MRAQLHKAGNDVRIYSKSGHNFAGRFPEIETAFCFFPARAAIVLSEIAHAIVVLLLHKTV